jgi:hypothetical protein
VTDVKLRAFMPPGTVLTLRADVEAGDGPVRAARLAAHMEGQKRPVGAARVEFTTTP